MQSFARCSSALSFTRFSKSFAASATIRPTFAATAAAPISTTSGWSSMLSSSAPPTWTTSKKAPAAVTVAAPSATVLGGGVRGIAGGFFFSNNSSSSTALRLYTSPAHKRHVKKKRRQEQQVGVTGKPTIPAHERGIQVPSIDVAKSMPCGFSEMDNEPLVVIAEMGNHKARKEVLRRHVMMIDECDYETADAMVVKIGEKNREGIVLATFPYKVGITAALLTGMVSIPMVFDVNLALWFNHHYVTMDIPEPEELDTILETGSWTWNWMEPALGTASFVLLCLQFSREQIKNLGMKPYTEKLKERRAKSLIAAFPRYDARILQDFVDTDKMVK